MCLFHEPGILQRQECPGIDHYPVEPGEEHGNSLQVAADILKPRYGQDSPGRPVGVLDGRNLANAALFYRDAE